MPIRREKKSLGSCLRIDSEEANSCSLQYWIGYVYTGVHEEFTEYARRNILKESVFRSSTLLCTQSQNWSAQEGTCSLVLLPFPTFQHLFSFPA